MGRRPRSRSGTDCYHVVARGNNHQMIFFSEGDFVVYRQLLLRCKARYTVEIYHYCLMGNHVHLVMKAGDLPVLSSFMHDLQRAYFLFRGKRDKISGHLWQGRFKSFSIEEESYLMECGRYVERNPVRAGLVSDPKDYPWSSYRAYAYGSKEPLISLSPVYLGFGKVPEERQRLYRDYVSILRPYEKSDSVQSDTVPGTIRTH